MLLRFDEGGTKLRFGRVWRGSDLDLDAFERALAERTFIRGTGTSGPGLGDRGDRVGSRCRRRARRSGRSGGGARPGLRSAVAFPLLLAGDVVGVASSSAASPRPAQPDSSRRWPRSAASSASFSTRMRAGSERERLLRSERAARAAAEEVARTLGKLEEVTQAALRHVASGDVLRGAAASDRPPRRGGHERDPAPRRRAAIPDRPCDGRLRPRARARGADPVRRRAWRARVAATRTPVVIRDLDRGRARQPSPPGARDQVARRDPDHDRRPGDRRRPCRLGRARAFRRGRHAAAPADGRPARARDQPVAALRGRAHRAARSRAGAPPPLLPGRGEHAPRFVARLRVDAAGRRPARRAPSRRLVRRSTSPTRRASLERIATAHVDADKVSLVRELERRWPPQQDAPFGPYAVLRSGTPELSPEITEDLLQAAAQDDEHLAVIRELGLRLVHVRADVGARPCPRRRSRSSTAESERSYTEADLALAEELARRAAVAVENALLYRAGRGACAGRARARRGRRRRVPRRQPRRDRALEPRRGGDHRPAGGGGRRPQRGGGGSRLGRRSRPRVPVVAEHDRAAARAETVPLEIGAASSGSRSRASALPTARSTRSAT